MRLIRCITDNQNSIFNNTFNSEITIKPNSKICLNSLTSEEAVEGLTINDANDTIRVQMTLTGIGGGIKTIRLTHRVYKDTDFDLFFKDFTDKLNSVIVCGGIGVGYEYLVSLDNTGKVAVLGKISPFSEISPSSWIKNGTEYQVVQPNNKNVWSSASTEATDQNDISIGLEQLFCNGGAIFSCRINTLVDDDPTKQGFIMGLTDTDPTANPNYTTGIIKHAISVGSVNGTYAYITYGELKETLVPIDYQSANSADNDILTITLTENKYEYKIYNKTNPNGILLHSVEKTEFNTNKLYPFICFRGGKDNCKVDYVKYTPSPFNTSPYSQLISSSVEEIQPFTAIPTPSKRATQQFIEFANISLANYLGFNNQRNPPELPIPNVYELNLIASQQFIPTSYTDSFMVELLNLSVNSYDGATNGRRNLLAVVPQSYNEKQQIVFQASNLLWIDLLNSYPIDIRELKLRLIRNDGTPLRIKGLSVAVILIKEENEI